MSCRWTIALIYFGVGVSAQSQSADDLVKLLLKPPMTPQLQAAMAGPTCGVDQAMVQYERGIKDQLLAMGDSGISALERAIDRIGKGTGPWRRGLLFSVYAENAGDRAYRRLRAMVSSQRLSRADHWQLDRAIAVAHGLTSYVDSLRGPTGLLFCNEYEPREALDDLVVASETGDRRLLAASLGPEALAAMGGGQANVGWAMSGARPGKGSTLGYRFPNADRVLADSLTIDTDFENASSGHCGTSAITFLKIDHPDFHGRKKYVVNNPDLRSLLKLIAGCASDPTRR